MLRYSFSLLGRQLVHSRNPLNLQLQCTFFAQVHCSSTARDAASAYIKKHEISVSDEDAPSPILSFADSGLPDDLLNKLGSDFINPTPIQAQGLPIALAGKNLVGVAQTGSGKTLAFLLPAFVHLLKEGRRNISGQGPSVLILAPTRELANQIEEVAAQFRRLLRINTVCCIGGMSRGRQLSQYDRGAHLMIGTPGRINDFLESGDISLKNCGYVVLDEADRMLDMGFEPQVRSILESVSEERQTLMFSATWPEEVQELAQEFLNEYTFMNIGSVELAANKNISQTVTVCPRDYKQEAFLQDMDGECKGKKALVFTERKATVDRVERMLRNKNIPAIGIHGDKSQNQRDTTIRRFREGSCKVMIATDVAARGLDIKDVDYVINYDFPLDIENYIHRIGRTGRAEKKGKSITYMTPEDGRFGYKLIKILEETDQPVSQELRDLAKEGKYAKTEQKRYQNKNNRRNYGYRGLGYDEDESYYGSSRNQSWGNKGRRQDNWGDSGYGNNRGRNRQSYGRKEREYDEWD